MALVISFSHNDASKIYRILEDSIFIDKDGRLPIFHAVSTVG